MINSLMFTITLLCSQTKLIGFEQGMTSDDRTSLKSATGRCKEIYPDAPCLKVFEKRSERAYRAICGKEKK
jgi:hypothetical protein